jgi:hypothetical protein
MREANLTWTSNSNRKERAGLLQVPTPSGSVVLVTSLLLLRPLVGKSQSHWSRAQSRLTPGSRKPSVPGRVHSVPESCGSQAALGALPGSNPLLTHGTVESPTKRFLRRFLKNREPPPPISPVAPMSNTGPGWRRLSKISWSSLRDHLRRTAASNQSAGSNAQHLLWLTRVLIN